MRLEEISIRKMLDEEFETVYSGKQWNLFDLAEELNKQLMMKSEIVRGVIRCWAMEHPRVTLRGDCRGLKLEKIVTQRKTTGKRFTWLL